MSPRGGRQPGAGRPPLPPEMRLRKRTIRLLPSDLAWIEAQRRPGETEAETMRRLILRGRRSERRSA